MAKKQDTRGPTQRWLDWVHNSGIIEPRYVPEENTFPYFQKLDVHPTDRDKTETLSVADRVYWYLVNSTSDFKIPILLDGETNTGKTMVAENLAHELGIHRSKITGSEDRKLRDFLTRTGTEVTKEGLQRIVDRPSHYTTAELFKGLMFIDEVQNCTPKTLRSLYNIFQGKDEDFDTHEGVVALDWLNHKLIVSGNMTYVPTPLDPAFKRRFVAVRFVDQTDRDLLNDVLQYKTDLRNYNRGVTTVKPELPDKYKPVRLKPEVRSADLDKALNDFASDLYICMKKYVNLHKDGGSPIKGYFRRLRESYDEMGSVKGAWKNTTFREPDTNGDGVGSKHFHKPAWTKVPDTAKDWMERMNVLYHSQMTERDYRNVVEDIIYVPLTLQQNLTRKRVVKQFAEDCKAIIHEVLHSHWGTINNIDLK